MGSECLRAGRRGPAPRWQGSRGALLLIFRWSCFLTDTLPWAPGPGPASAPHPNPPGVSPPQAPTRTSPWACSDPSLAPQTSQMVEGAGRPSPASPNTASWAEGASVDLGPWPRLLASLSCLKGCCRAQVVSGWRPGPCGPSKPGNMPSGCRSLFSRGSSQPRDRTQVSCIVGRRFTI